MSVNPQNLLAIVIPAYKRTYLQEALNSISRQTHKGFTVYIGDDNSPEDLYPLIKDFESKINILYHRFNKNMGGSDLVAQWSRCIDLTKDEPWIWLFSDDDLMDENCVSLFYETIEANKDEELFHFDVKIINENSIVTGKFQPFPQWLTSYDFFSKRINYELSSYVVEYIFSREVYVRESKFEKFDLAWCSDDATWIKFGKRKGIHTIKGAFVRWRYSQINISSKVEDRKTILRKLASSEAYLKWVKQFFAQNNFIDHTSKFEKLKWMLHQFVETSVLPLKEKQQLVDELIKKLGYEDIRVKAKLYVTYMEFKKRVM
jgi:glycosyltransferase involved in cell wall biosynthesis